MCTDCQDNPARPDITLVRLAGDFAFQPHSAAGNAYLNDVFAAFDGDLTWADATHIVANARNAGLVVVER